MATKDRTALKDEFKNGNLATGERFADLIDSVKPVQEPVADPAASGTSLSFIDSISQDADGKITATKKTLDLSNAHELNPFKGWYKTGDTLPTDGFDGAYLYFKDTSELTGQTTIYRWNGTTYADTGTVVDTSNVNTFETRQPLNEVAIDGTGLDNPTSNALAKAGDVMQLAAKLEGVTASETKVTQQPITGSYVKGADGSIISSSNTAYLEIALGDTKSVRFLGGWYTSSSYASGYAFGHYTDPSDPTTWVTDKSSVFDTNANTLGTKEYIIAVPEGATHFRTTTATSTVPALAQNFYCYGLRGESVKDLIPNVEEELTGEVEVVTSYNLLDVNAYETGKAVSSTTGEVLSTSTSNAAASPWLAVEAGKKYYMYGGGYGTVGGANQYGAVYDKNKKFLRQAKLNTSGTSGILFEAQEGDAYVRHTMNNSATFQAFLPELDGGGAPSISGIINKPGNVNLPYKEVTLKHTNSPLLISEGNAVFASPSLSLTGSERVVNTADTIAAGGSLGLSSTSYPLYIKGCHIISFKGFLEGAFGENDFMRFGVGRGNTTGKTIKITASDVTIERYDRVYGYLPCKSPVAHGLTLTGFVMCEVSFTWHGGKIRLISQGGCFVHEWNLSEFNDDAGEVARENVGVASLYTSIAMTSVELSQTSDRFMKPVWVFGDSYTSVFEYGNNGRWPYSMIYTYGIDGFLLDGYAGAESANIYPDLVKALMFGTPKYLIWCLGLNDATYAEVVYFNYAKLVEKLCKEKGITLIYERLPYRWDQNAAFRGRLGKINTYIENSGYRYIDFYEAVSADSDGHWYNGMLNGDNAHPTPLGAQVLAGQILVDFPEIANYK